MLTHIDYIFDNDNVNVLLLPIQLIYCQIPKVATITLRRILLVLTGKVNTTDPASLKATQVYGPLNRLLGHLHHYTHHEIRYRLKNYFKFVFVRPPFERVLSAFRNKFAEKNGWSKPYFQKMGYAIAKKYRNQTGAPINPEDPDISFQEFLKFVSDPHQPRKGTDVHWRPYHELCNPCLVDFDFIGKLEYMQEDFDRLSKLTGIGDVVKMPSRKESQYRKEETDRLMNQYYSKIPKSDMEKLTQRYTPDILLFNYTLPTS